MASQSKVKRNSNLNQTKKAKKAVGKRLALARLAAKNRKEDPLSDNASVASLHHAMSNASQPNSLGRLDVLSHYSDAEVVDEPVLLDDRGYSSKRVTLCREAVHLHDLARDYGIKRVRLQRVVIFAAAVGWQSSPEEIFALYKQRYRHERNNKRSRKGEKTFRAQRTAERRARYEKYAAQSDPEVDSFDSLPEYMRRDLRRVQIQKGEYGRLTPLDFKMRALKQFRRCNPSLDLHMKRANERIRNFRPTGVAYCESRRKRRSQGVIVPVYPREHAWGEHRKRQERYRREHSRSQQLLRDAQRRREWAGEDN